MIKNLQVLGSPAASWDRDRDRNLGVLGHGLGHFLSGPGFCFHSLPDPEGHNKIQVLFWHQFSAAVFFFLTSADCFKNILGGFGQILSLIQSIFFFCFRESLKEPGQSWGVTELRKTLRLEPRLFLNEFP